MCNHWHLHILWNYHHVKCNNHLPSSKIIVLFLICSLWLYIYSFYIIMIYLLCKWSFVPLNPLHLFHPTSTPSGTSLLCVSLLLLLSCWVVSDSLQPMDCSMPGFEVLHYPPEFAQTHVHWVSDAIQPSHPLFSPSLPTFNISQHQGLMSWLFSSGGQSIGASASVLPMNIQGWFPSGFTGLISLQSKRLSRVFSNTKVQKHQFFGARPSLWATSHIHAWLLENHCFD